MQKNVNHALEFSKYVKQNLIPTYNGVVSSDFIDFVYQSDLDNFIQHFELDKFFPEQSNDMQFMSSLRKEATVAIVSQIADINKDFFSYSIIGNNNILNLRTIIECLGFELILKTDFQLKDTLSEEDFQQLVNSRTHSNSIIEKANDGYLETSNENVFYFYNKENGFLWSVETRRGYFVVSSVLYGNIRDCLSRKDIKNKFQNASRLPYSDVYGFSMDMTHLPINQYEQIITNTEAVPEWLIIPHISFEDETNEDHLLLPNLDLIDDKVRFNLFGHIIENHNREELPKSDIHNIDSQLLNIPTETLKRELFMVDFLFDEVLNLHIYYTYFKNKGLKMSKAEVNHFVYNFFNNKSFSIKKIKDSDFVDFLSLFEAKDINIILLKESMLAEGFGISENIVEYIKLKAHSKTQH